MVRVCPFAQRLQVVVAKANADSVVGLTLLRVGAGHGGTLSLLLMIDGEPLQERLRGIGRCAERDIFGERTTCES
jgi:hypothetical protein